MKKIFDQSGSYWRILSHIWMIISFAVFVVAIFYPQLDNLAGVIAIIYVAILSIYAGTKECNRWTHYHHSRHSGEMAVILWTLFLIGIVITNLLLRGYFEIPGALIPVYTGVLAIFAITQRSKHLFGRHEVSCNGTCPLCGHHVEIKGIEKVL